ncbi:MAG: MvaI/BcnI family restriction endonuclease, partial [Alloprevotella sp.]
LAFTHLSKKHAPGFRLEPYFRYKQIEHTKNPNIGQFDALIEQNLITIDLLLSRPSGHGDTYSFKIKKKGMPLLFPESRIYSIE